MKLFKTKKGYLTLVKGVSPSGKTNACIIDALNDEGSYKKVIYFAYESSEKVMLKRIEKLIDNEQNNTWLYVASLPFITVETLCEIVRDEKPHAIYIDYLSIVRSNKFDRKIISDEKRLNETVYILDVLSKLAIDENMEVIVITTANRRYKYTRDINIIKNEFMMILNKTNNKDHIYSFFIKHDIDSELSNNGKIDYKISDMIPYEVFEFVNNTFIYHSKFTMNEQFKI